MRKPAVMFYEVFQEEEAAIRRFLPRDIPVLFTAKTIQEQKDRRLPADVISVRTQSRIPLGWAAELRGILTRSQGYDHVVAYLRQTGAPVKAGYLGDYCSRSVAEHAVMMMLVLQRKLKKQARQFAVFQRSGLTGGECFQHRALVVGVGRIGSQIVDLCRGMKMRVQGVDIVRRQKGLTYVSLEEGLGWADVIFCAVPLTPKTYGMLSRGVFKNAQPGVVLVNVSRGEVTPVEDLKRLLAEGILGGLGMDVYPQEAFLADALRNRRLPRSSQTRTILSLKNKENVWLTPHNAFNTREGLERKAALSAQSVEFFLKKGRFPCPVLLCKSSF